MRIYARDLVPDEHLHSNIVLRHKVNRVFLLADASWPRPTLNRVRAFEYERSCFAREVGRESEDLLEFCRIERTASGHSAVMDGWKVIITLDQDISYSGLYVMPLLVFL